MVAARNTMVSVTSTMVPLRPSPGNPPRIVFVLGGGELKCATGDESSNK